MAGTGPASLPPGIAAIAALDPSDAEQVHVGNIHYVRGLLADLLCYDLGLCWMHAQGEAEWTDVHAVLVKRVERLAAAFLGKDPAVAYLPGWNEPGGIDAFLRLHFDLWDRPPERVVADTLAKLVHHGRTLMETHGHSEAALLEAADPMLTVIARLLVGLPPVDDGAG